MFAVTGWNVSADKLKTETENPKKDKRKEKKRKDREQRSNDAGPAFGANSERVDDRRPPFKEQVGKIQHETPKSADKKRKLDVLSNTQNGDGQRHTSSKKAKLSARADKDGDRPPAQQKVQASEAKASHEHDEQHLLSKKDEKGNGERRQTRKQHASNAEHLSPLEVNFGLDVPPVSSLTTKLTPLQSAMRAKLMGSRFRYLNESLYTKPSSESIQLFNQNPNFYTDYHAGFRQQVSSWPENPVDSFFDELQRRAKITSKDSESRALPRTAGTCRVADLGCGDASLAKKVKPIMKTCKIQVDSYDLQSTEPFVIKADIAELPVTDDSVNVAVLCLALMGTNWIDFIEEAWRVLHWKGELWIAEIKSRFSRTQRKPPDHSVGKKRKPNKEELKKQKQQVEQEETDRTIAEMDGATQASETTDVSGFVSVLEKRGFGLADDNAIDLSNKMFVRMKFVKNRPPVKGKHAGSGAKKKNWREMLREGEDDSVNEAGVLQPCVYKLR